MEYSTTFSHNGSEWKVMSTNTLSNSYKCENKITIYIDNNLVKKYIYPTESMDFNSFDVRDDVDDDIGDLE